MAVQVAHDEPAVRRPHLYVVDFEHAPSRTVVRPPRHPQLLSFRRKRMLRRLRQAGAAATWAAGSAMLVLVLLGGLAGLR